MDQQAALVVIRYLSKQFNLDVQINTIKEVSENSCRDQVEVIIDYLNQKTDSKYKSNSDANRKLINSRLSEYTMDDLKMVIDIKSKEWLGTQHQKYLRPSTLFRKSNFDNYINEKPQINPLLSFFKEDN